jgi:hypothetical protein
VADVYDALTTKRFYKEAFSHAKARQIILNLRGSHFDPEVVDAFLALEDQFNRVREEKLGRRKRPFKPPRRSGWPPASRPLTRVRRRREDCFDEFLALELAIEPGP